ncbi:NRDE protein-domain-containing protein [Zopfochytrium polystomum]|nr:NRDE protein-domain-containing protein [Zopfochytrium polystomum]
MCIAFVFVASDDHDNDDNHDSADGRPPPPPPTTTTLGMGDHAGIGDRDPVAPPSAADDDDDGSGVNRDLAGRRRTSRRRSPFKLSTTPASNKPPPTAQTHSIILSNRDEFLDRPAAPLHAWPDAPHILAGRDLGAAAPSPSPSSSSSSSASAKHPTAGGTWLGVTTTGRFALLTNFREPPAPPTTTPQPTRGRLVAEFLAPTTDGDVNGAPTPAEYAARVLRDSKTFQGFNLVLGDISRGGGEAAVACSNRAAAGGAPVTVERGRVFAVSNGPMDVPAGDAEEWRKVRVGRDAVTSLVEKWTADAAALDDDDDDTTPWPARAAPLAAALGLLRDVDRGRDDADGDPDPRSAVCVRLFRLPDGRAYATRTQTVVFVDWEGRGRVVETERVWRDEEEGGGGGEDGWVEWRGGESGGELPPEGRWREARFWVGREGGW